MAGGSACAAHVPFGSRQVRWLRPEYETVKSSISYFLSCKPNGFPKICAPSEAYLILTKKLPHSSRKRITVIQPIEQLKRKNKRQVALPFKSLSIYSR